MTPHILVQFDLYQWISVAEGRFWPSQHLPTFEKEERGCESRNTLKAYTLCWNTRVDPRYLTFITLPFFSISNYLTGFERKQSLIIVCLGKTWPNHTVNRKKVNFLFALLHFFRYAWNLLHSYVNIKKQAY